MLKTFCYIFLSFAKSKKNIEIYYEFYIKNKKNYEFQNE